MTIFDNYEVWFVIGSQHLYGPETLRQVTQAHPHGAGVNQHHNPNVNKDISQRV